jgi:hypothetical protein
MTNPQYVLQQLQLGAIEATVLEAIVSDSNTLDHYRRLTEAPASSGPFYYW